MLFIYSHPHQPRNANKHDWHFPFVTDRIDRMCSVWILSADTTQRPWRSCYYHFRVSIAPPLPCINKKFTNSDGHQMACGLDGTIGSSLPHSTVKIYNVKHWQSSRTMATWRKYISYHSPIIKNDITRSDACINDAGTQWNRATLVARKFLAHRKRACSGGRFVICWSKNISLKIFSKNIKITVIWTTLK